MDSRIKGAAFDARKEVGRRRFQPFKTTHEDDCFKLRWFVANDFRLNDWHFRTTLFLLGEEAELVPFFHRRRLGFLFPRSATRNGFHLSDETQSFSIRQPIRCDDGRDGSPDQHPDSDRSAGLLTISPQRILSQIPPLFFIFMSLFRLLADDLHQTPADDIFSVSSSSWEVARSKSDRRFHSSHYRPVLVIRKLSFLGGEFPCFNPLARLGSILAPLFLFF
ncbi:hypothetical protein CEXT_364741 [Caerostris extrusa]|uniref:Uncharacterized protein n=1 Tax=Caerostris extrusa TaxID=172846 RepID=A0AAV4X8V1_CAEEX|nr:hypothetical protein CEXT_364741 [Caerostris extrusa]